MLQLPLVVHPFREESPICIVEQEQRANFKAAVLVIGRAMQTPTSELQNLLQGSLDSKSPEELAPLAELLAQQAREARLENPQVGEFVQLEVRYLELAIGYARTLRNAGQEARLIESLAELTSDAAKANELRLKAAGAYAAAGQPDNANRIYKQVGEATGNADLSAQLAAGIGSATIRIDHEQDPDESLAIVETLIDQAETAGLTALHLRLALVRTRIFIQMGRPDAAAHSIGIADKLGDSCPESEYRMLVKAVAAHVWSKQAKFQPALDAIQDVLADAAGDKYWGEINEHAACVYLHCGLHSRARAALEKTVDLYHESGDRFGKARVNLHLGRLLVDEARWEDARAPLALAESEFKALGREHWLGYTQLASVEILMGLGQISEAERRLREIQDSPAIKSSRQHTSTMHEMRGDLLRWSHLHPEALRQYSLARDVARDAGLMREAARGALNCAHMHYLLGRLAPAQTQALLSIGLLGRDWDYAVIEYIESKAALTRIHLKRGHMPEARKTLVDALECADELDLLEAHNALRAQVLIRDLRQLENLVAAAERERDEQP